MDLLALSWLLIYIIKDKRNQYLDLSQKSVIIFEKRKNHEKNSTDYFRCTPF